MKKIVLFVTLLLLTISFNSYSRNYTLKNQIAEGYYLQKELVTVKTLQHMPIPKSAMDYIFIQSIGEVTNVVIGHFKTGKQYIQLITDNNADGVVDKSYIWYTESKRLKRVPRVSQKITKEAFFKMKEEVFNGIRKEYSPNMEGAKYMKTLLEKSPALTTVMKCRKGYRTSICDVDDRRITRAEYVISDEGNIGVDISFDLKYRYKQNTRVKPVIPICVYARDSQDPYMKKKAKELLKYLQDYSLN